MSTICVRCLNESANLGFAGNASGGGKAFDLIFSPVVLLITLLFVIGISVVASFGPALSASRLRLNEILQYE